MNGFQYILIFNEADMSDLLNLVTTTSANINGDMATTLT